MMVANWRLLFCSQSFTVVNFVVLPQQMTVDPRITALHQHAMSAGLHL